MKNLGVSVIPYKYAKGFIDPLKVKRILEIIEARSDLSIKDQILKIQSQIRKTTDFGERDLLVLQTDVLQLLIPVKDGTTELSGFYLDQIRRLMYKEEIKSLSAREYKSKFNEKFRSKIFDGIEEIDLNLLIWNLHKIWMDSKDLRLQ